MSFSNSPAKKILVDSNVLIALNSRKDSTYDRAIDIFERIILTKKVLNDLIVNEIASVLLIRTKDLFLSSEVSSHLLEDKNADFTTRRVTKKLMIRTQEIFADQKGKSLSFTDCSLIAQAEIEGIDTILTFDKNLKKAFHHKFKFLG